MYECMHSKEDETNEHSITKSNPSKISDSRYHNNNRLRDAYIHNRQMPIQETVFTTELLRHSRNDKGCLIKRIW